MAPEVYELNLASSGKLKLRAKGLLAKGVFEALAVTSEPTADVAEVLTARVQATA